MEDLIQNAHTLFDERPSRSPSIDVARAMSTHTHSSLILSPEPPESAEVQATGSTSRHLPGLVDGIPSSTQSSFSSSESRLTLPPIDPPSPLLLGPSSSKSFTKGEETTTQEKRVPPRATTALPNSTPPDVGPLPATTSVAEWCLNQSRVAPDSDTLTIPQSPSESALSDMSDFPLSSVTSPQTSMLGSP